MYIPTVCILDGGGIAGDELMRAGEGFFCAVHTATQPRGASRANRVRPSMHPGSTGRHGAPHAACVHAVGRAGTHAGTAAGDARPSPEAPAVASGNPGPRKYRRQPVAPECAMQIAGAAAYSVCHRHGSAGWVGVSPSPSAGVRRGEPSPGADVRRGKPHSRSTFEAGRTLRRWHSRQLAPRPDRLLPSTCDRPVRNPTAIPRSVAARNPMPRRPLSALRPERLKATASERERGRSRSTATCDAHAPRMRRVPVPTASCAALRRCPCSVARIPSYMEAPATRPDCGCAARPRTAHAHAEARQAGGRAARHGAAARLWRGCGGCSRSARAGGARCCTHFPPCG
jgi:hypothetical protein